MRRGNRVKPLVYMSLPVPCPDARGLRKRASRGLLELRHTSVTTEVKMASIRKRNNKWQVQVRRKGAGSIAKSFMTKSEATRWAYKQELNMESGLYGHIDPADITLRDLLKRYKSDVTPTKRGAAQETRRISRLNHRVCGHRLNHINNLVCSA